MKFEHVIYYDVGMPFDEIYAMYEQLTQTHGNNFLFLPSLCQYKEFSLEEMEQVYEMMGKILEEAKNDNKKIAEH